MIRIGSVTRCILASRPISKKDLFQVKLGLNTPIWNKLACALHPDSRFATPDSRLMIPVRIRVSRFAIPDSRVRRGVASPDSCLRIRVSGFASPDSRLRIRISGVVSPESRLQIRVSGFASPDSRPESRLESRPEIGLIQITNYYWWLQE
jgi:hypothetical protein